MAGLPKILWTRKKGNVKLNSEYNKLIISFNHQKHVIVCWKTFLVWVFGGFLKHIIKLVEDTAPFLPRILGLQIHEYRELIISFFNGAILLQVYSRHQKQECHRGIGHTQKLRSNYAFTI